MIMPFCLSRWTKSVIGRNSGKGHPMKKVYKLMIICIVFLVVGTFSYTIKSQQNKIAELESELQLLETKYKVIINDPLIKDAMQVGG